MPIVHRITLHLPEHFNDGSPIPEELLKGYHQAMGRIAYEAMLDGHEGSAGYQISHEEGGWLSDSEDWIEEPMRLIKINVALLGDAYEKVKGLGQKAQTAFVQEAIYVTHEPGIDADLVRDRCDRVLLNQKEAIG